MGWLALLVEKKKISMKIKIGLLIFLLLSFLIAGEILFEKSSPNIFRGENISQISWEEKIFQKGEKDFKEVYDFFSRIMLLSQISESEIHPQENYFLLKYASERGQKKVFLIHELPGVESFLLKIQGENGVEYFQARNANPYEGVYREEQPFFHKKYLQMKHYPLQYRL